jgi:ferredoxin
MSPYFNYEPPRFQATLDVILDEEFPPVARCRLLSEGIKPYHRLALAEAEIAGDKGCLGCGNCVDSCPVLRREPERLVKTEQRTSMALESVVGEDCEKCYACILGCPQVETAIKDFVVDTRVPEVIAPSKTMTFLDKYLMAVVAMAIGVLLGLFLRT